MPCLVTHSPPPQSFHPTQTLQQQLRRSRADLPVPEATGFRSSSDLPRPSRRAGRCPIGCFEPNYVSQEPLDVARTWSVTSLSWKDGASLLFSVFSVEAQRKWLPPAWPSSWCWKLRRLAYGFAFSRADCWLRAGRPGYRTGNQEPGVTSQLLRCLASQKALRPGCAPQLTVAHTNSRPRPVRTFGRARGEFGFLLLVSWCVPELKSLGRPHWASRCSRASNR